jgi:4-amino-4-deoxy-L-arabinose transferase-like glycosyltransferase
MMGPVVVVVIAFALAGVGVAIWPLTIEVKRVITDFGRAAGIVVAVISGTTGLGVAALLRRGRADAVPVVIGAGTLLVLVVLQVSVYTPRHNRAFPTREVAARFVAVLPPGAEVAYVDSKFTTGLLFYMQPPRLEVQPFTALADLAEHPRRYALVPYEVMLGMPRKCGSTVPLREETMFFSRYVLLNLNGTGPRC